MLCFRDGLAVRAEPSVISPNRDEAEELVGHEFNDENDRRAAVNELRSLGAKEAIMTLGYAGWSPGQLESEIHQNGWLHCSADAELVFGKDNDGKYNKALKEALEKAKKAANEEPQTGLDV